MWVAYQVLLSLSNVSHESVRMSPTLSPFSSLFRFISLKSGPDGHGPLLKVAAVVLLLVLSLLWGKTFFGFEKISVDRVLSFLPSSPIHLSLEFGLLSFPLALGLVITHD